MKRKMATLMANCAFDLKTFIGRRVRKSGGPRDGIKESFITTKLMKLNMPADGVLNESCLRSRRSLDRHKRPTVESQRTRMEMK